MKRHGLISGALGALALGFFTAASPAPAAAPDWVATYATTPDGTHVMGNPQARVKLIEFVSYTCSHCAHFEAEGDLPLRNSYVAPGKVSVEIRHVIRDPIDMVLVLLAECGPADRFWGNHQAIFADYPRWLGNLRVTAPEQREKWNTGTLGNRFKLVANDLGLYDLMQQRGYSRAQVDQCLSDQTRMDAFAAQTEADGKTFGVNSTPSFALNGTLLPDVHTWGQLQQELDSRAN